MIFLKELFDKVNFVKQQQQQQQQTTGIVPSMQNVNVNIFA